MWQRRTCTYNFLFGYRLIALFWPCQPIIRLWKRQCGIGIVEVNVT